jgi:hypothetical protein
MLPQAFTPILDLTNALAYFTPTTGATTLSITAQSITTFFIMTLSTATDHLDTQHINRASVCLVFHM